MSNDSNLPTSLLGSGYTAGVSNLPDDLASDLIEVTAVSQTIAYTYASSGGAYYFRIEVDGEYWAIDQWGDYTGAAHNPTITFPIEFADETPTSKTNWSANAGMNRENTTGFCVIDTTPISSTQMAVDQMNGDGVAQAWNFVWHCVWRQD